MHACMHASSYACMHNAYVLVSVCARVRVCMCVCACVSVFVFACVCVCVFVYAYRSPLSRTNSFLRLRSSTCRKPLITIKSVSFQFLSVYKHVCVNIHTYVRNHKCVCMYVCVGIHTYTCIYMYICCIGRVCRSNV